MNQEAYKNIDVDTFKEILESELFVIQENDSNILSIMNKISNIHKVEIKTPGLDIDRKKFASEIKFKQYGFKAKTDFKLEFKQDLFESETIISLIPQKIYELEDFVKNIPVPYTEKGKQMHQLLADAFERLKIKAKNILQNSSNDEQITHYAKKNIQVASRNCYEARMQLVKIQKNKVKEEIYLVFLANLFMINVVTYLQNMFSSYYIDNKYEKHKQKVELYDAIDMNVLFSKSIVNEKIGNLHENKEQTKHGKIVWNDQLNILTTLFYDLMHKRVKDNKILLQADVKDIQELIEDWFVDKEGKPINKLTLETYLREDKDEKRTKGKKRLDINTYTDNN